MFCSACGQQNTDDATFCTKCGKQMASSTTTQPPSSSAATAHVHAGLKESGTVTAMSVVGFVFGLIGMMGSFIPCIGSLAFFIGIPAALISSIALGIAYSQHAKKTFAVVAVTISLIGVVISGWQYFSIVSAGKNAERELKKGFVFPKVPAPAHEAMQPLETVRPEYINDRAGIIDSNTKTKLTSYLKGLEEKTTAQFAVLTVKSLKGRSIEDLSLETARKWKLGTKEKNNGVLFLVSLQDRKWRIEVGTGLEHILSNSYLNDLGREQIVPNFKIGNYSQGISAAVIDIGNRISMGQTATD